MWGEGGRRSGVRDDGTCRAASACARGSFSTPESLPALKARAIADLREALAVRLRSSAGSSAETTHLSPGFMWPPLVLM